jgi:hypothetical protein
LNLTPEQTQNATTGRDETQNNNCSRRIVKPTKKNKMQSINGVCAKKKAKRYRVEQEQPQQPSHSIADFKSTRMLCPREMFHFFQFQTFKPWQDEIKPSPHTMMS